MHASRLALAHPSTRKLDDAWRPGSGKLESAFATAHFNFQGWVHVTDRRRPHLSVGITTRTVTRDSGVEKYGRMSHSCITP